MFSARPGGPKGGSPQVLTLFFELFEEAGSGGHVFCEAAEWAEPESSQSAIEPNERIHISQTKENAAKRPILLGGSDDFMTL